MMHANITEVVNLVHSSTDTIRRMSIDLQDHSDNHDLTTTLIVEGHNHDDNNDFDSAEIPHYSEDDDDNNDVGGDGNQRHRVIGSHLSNAEFQQALSTSHANFDPSSSVIVTKRKSSERSSSSSSSSNNENNTNLLTSFINNIFPKSTHDSNNNINNMNLSTRIDRSHLSTIQSMSSMEHDDDDDDDEDNNNKMRSSSSATKLSTTTTTILDEQQALLMSPLSQQQKQKQQQSQQQHSSSIIYKHNDVHYYNNWNEIKLVIQLAIPNIIIQVGQTIPSFITASYIGRTYGSIYLDGFMLANLTCNLCTLTLLQGISSACDTLSPQAYGSGNYSEVGYIAIRGMILSCIIIFPILILLILFIYPILLYVGEVSEVSYHATQWYQMYCISLPFFAFYQIQYKFLSSQHITTPVVIVTLFSSFIILPINLHTFGNPIYGYKFLGTAIASSLYIIIQSLLLFIYIILYKPYHIKTFPKLIPKVNLIRTIKRVMKTKPFMTFVTIGAGGMLASSEWIYWELLSLMIGTLGVVPLSVHTIPTQVTIVTFMIPMGIGISLAIRIGTVLPNNSYQAKQIAFYGFIVSEFIFAIMCIAMYTSRFYIYHIFTNEPDVIDGCEEIWMKVCIYCFVLFTFAVNMGITTGLGKQWLLGTLTIVFLWFVALPCAYYFAIVKEGGLNAAWQTIWPPYICINVILLISFIMTDWEKIGMQIREREGLEHDEHDISENLHHYQSPRSSLQQQQQKQSYGSIQHTDQQQQEKERK